jgi:hypothetical protein
VIPLVQMLFIWVDCNKVLAGNMFLSAGSLLCTCRLARCTLNRDCHKSPFPSGAAASLALWLRLYGRPSCVGLSPCCWCVVQHEDGRLYFVREGDPGPGTWSKPSDLQDVTEALSGQHTERRQRKQIAWSSFTGRSSCVRRLGRFPLCVPAFD